MLDRLFLKVIAWIGGEVGGGDHRLRDLLNVQAKLSSLECFLSCLTAKAVRDVGINLGARSAHDLRGPTVCSTVVPILEKLSMRWLPDSKLIETTKA